MSSVRSASSLAAILQENPKVLAQLQKDFARQLLPANGGGNRFFNSVPAEVLLADVGVAWLEEYSKFLTTFKVNANWYNEYGAPKDAPKAFINPNDLEAYKMFINKIIAVALDVLLDENADLDSAWIKQVDPQHQESRLVPTDEKLIINLVLSYLERANSYLKHGSVNIAVATFEMGKLGVAQAMEMIFNQSPQAIIAFIAHELASRRGAEFHASVAVAGLKPLTIDPQSGSGATPSSKTSASSSSSAFSPSASSSGSTSASPSNGSSTPHTPGSLIAHYAMFYKTESPSAENKDDKSSESKLKKGSPK